MEYDFRKIEQQWQQKWKADKVYKVSNDSTKPKYYVLDMFPYPSGAGLHVGHPLGYIASDIYSRYKRLKGFNVLHPMGFDSFGLPAEQYALETGQHPAETTEKNIATFKAQLDKIGFCYDWDREVRTSDPQYYKWTQWIFLQLFNSYFCNTEKKALPISLLIKKYETKGAMPKTGEPIPGKHFTAEQWNAFSKKEQEDILMNRRLVFSAFGEVNWCEALGTVLANDEVVNGISERGGHPVEKKKMRQWFLRITNYADRLLEGLETVEFSDAMKEMQKNWIGKSEGAEIIFSLIPSPRLNNSVGQASPDGAGGESDHHFQTADKKWWGDAKQLSRENRKEQTAAEKKLWEGIRNNQLGYKVRRQHVIGTYIADFAFLEKYLLIEIDGEYHNDAAQKMYDETRTSFLKGLGYRVIRFTNEEVEKKYFEVIKKIKEELNREVQAPLSARRGAGGEAKKLRVYTTRPDTIFGADFLVIAPEHEIVSQITSESQKNDIGKYLAYVKSRSERERLAEAKTITGCFTGAYAVNPFDGREIPIWIAEYVLAGYGTGAIMAVPCGDQRDFLFAKHFNIPITNIIGKHYTGEEANATKDAVLENSGFLNGLLMKDAIGVAINKIEELGIGKKKVNYRMRDAGFSRQRYWGEPFPIIWSDGIALPLDAEELPLELPHVDKYGPGPDGEGPLANLTDWVCRNTPVGVFLRETSTMPGYAGSSWYFLRYMDPHNNETFCDRKASDYWNQVDLYIGGTEHAVGHLLYSRMWTKVLYDLGLIGFDEPFKKLLNQGMITAFSYYVDLVELVKPEEEQEYDLFHSVHSEKGQSREGEVFIFSANEFERISNLFVHPITNEAYSRKRLIGSWRLKNISPYIESINGSYRVSKENLEKYIEKYGVAFAGFNIEQVVFNSAIQTDKVLTVRPENEKMSKSKFNVDNPDEIVAKYGADTFRMYEMFLGPVEASKPWDTKGIEGVHRFLRKLWRLFFMESNTPLSARRGDGGEAIWSNDKPSDAELKVLHRTIKKIEEDTERFSFNTAVSTFMICVNELTDLKCHKKEILEQLLILLTPYAPHIAEELWSQVGNEGSVLDAAYPSFNPALLVESEKEYPVSINGKLRTSLNLALDLEQQQVEALVLQNGIVQKWLDGKSPQKIIFVKNKMINVVI